MKIRLLPALTICIILAAAIFGNYKLKTYTYVENESNYLEHLQVAELPEQFALMSCEELSQILPDMPIILRVLAVGDIEHLFYASRQQVSIQEVYAGSDLQVGQEIYLYADHWNIILNDNIDALERGFVNIMKVGTEYLVFITHQIEGLDETIPVYQLYDDSYITPIFSYEKQDNIIVPTAGESTYVPYSLVAGNEFFAETEQGLRAWEELKSEMLSKYIMHE